MFSKLVNEGEGEIVQSNQFLVFRDDNGILLDVRLTYNKLYVMMATYFSPK